jgi:hypothetical protein
MQEARDDFFTRPRLAEQQHCGLGRGDLTGLGQYLTPARRPPDDAMEAGTRVQFVGQRLHARLEPRGALGGFVGAFGLLDAALTHQADRQT